MYVFKITLQLSVRVQIQTLKFLEDRNQKQYYHGWTETASL